MDCIELFTRYLETERRASPATVANYTQDLRQWEAYCAPDGGFDPSALTLTDLRAWVMALVEGKTAVGSVNRKISTVRSFFRFLMRQGIVSQNPALRLHTLRKGRKLPHFVEQSRMDPLVSVLSDPAEGYSDERDAVLLLLLYACGLRRSELAGLTLDSLNLAELSLRVFGKGAKERQLPLLPELRPRLEHYLQLRESLLEERGVCNSEINALFLSDKAEPLTVHQIYATVRKQLALAGVQGKQSPHVLRHTFATHLMQQGASIRALQQLLGHESLAATQIYTHNTIEKLKDSYLKAHPRAHDYSPKTEEEKPL